MNELPYRIASIIYEPFNLMIDKISVIIDNRVVNHFVKLKIRQVQFVMQYRFSSLLIFCMQYHSIFSSRLTVCRGIDTRDTKGNEK